jgi:hypothetical protein
MYVENVCLFFTVESDVQGSEQIPEKKNVSLIPNHGAIERHSVGFLIPAPLGYFWEREIHVLPARA